jgi:thiosulfate/3-mercaptopyruvate sulfurtransferase
LACLAAGAIEIGSSGEPSRSVVAAEKEAAATPAGAKKMLVSPAELQAWLKDADTRVVDVRPQAAYESGHIPGAVRVDGAAWEEKSSTADGLRDRGFWATAIGGRGLGRDTRVVLYGANVVATARVWWLLKYCGLRDVALLDGGWEAWRQAGGAIATDLSEPKAVSFVPEFQVDRLAERPLVQAGLKNAHQRLWDARSTGEYTGQQVIGSRPGRIPGAVHLDWQNLLDETGRFRPARDLERLLADKGITREAPVVTYCYSGGRASVAAFVAELLGYPKVKNYYGSWREWSACTDLPAQTQKSPGK